MRKKENCLFFSDGSLHKCPQHSELAQEKTRSSELQLGVRVVMRYPNTLAIICCIRHICWKLDWNCGVAGQTVVGSGATGRACYRLVPPFKEEA